MSRTVFCLVSMLFYTGLFAQKDCRQDDYQQQLLLLHPGLSAQYNKIEALLLRHQSARTGGIDTVSYTPEKITIPVVVHVLWNSAAQNISVSQVLSQIDVLNKDYGGSNTDRNKIPAYFSALAASCGFSFALAKTDPQGQPTTGIVRKHTGMTVFGFDDKAKSSAAGGDDGWNADAYLNIWVCNLDNGISGYASAPGGPKDKDGVVISTGVFGTLGRTGPYNKGRTAVHEIGHWLNLRHIWGDAPCGDDQVDDTPTQQAANRGCNTGEKFTCGSTAHGDMYMNYMDFSDDACMYMFTKGQEQRMRVLFEVGGPRNSLLYSQALTGNGLPLQDTAAANEPVALLLYPNPATTDIILSLNGDAARIGTKMYICNQLGQLVKSFICTSKLQQVNVSALPAGLYFVKTDDARTSVIKKFVKQ